jgi:hypothetical protein
MPKVVESKLVFRGDDQISSKMAKINESIAKMGSLAKEASDNLQGMMDAAGGGAPRGGRGRAAQSAQRSPYAPSFTGGRPVFGVGGGGGGEREKKEKEAKGGPYPGWHSWLKFAGMGMAGGGAMLGASVNQMTPAVGGMMAGIGSAISPVLGGLGMIAGIPLMAGGALMQISSIMAQPAIQHYKQFGDIYRRIGTPKAEEALRTGALAGLSPEESMRYAGQLSKMGGYEGLGAATGLRFKGFDLEETMGFMTAATKAGAAGGRGLAGAATNRKEYDYLAKVIGRAFAKDTDLPSIAQATDSMAGLMGMSTSYLADISEEGSAGMAAWTKFAEKGGTAMLRGEQGQKTAAGIWAGLAPGGKDPATEAWIMQSLGVDTKTGRRRDYREIMEMREEGPTGQGFVDLMEGMKGMSIEEQADRLRWSGMVPGWKRSKAFAAAYSKGGLEAAKKELTPEEIAKFKVEGLPERAPEVSKAQADVADLDLKKLQISKNKEILDAYITFEKGFTITAGKILTQSETVETAMKILGKAVTELSEHFGTEKFTPLEKALGVKALTKKETVPGKPRAPVN